MMTSKPMYLDLGQRERQIVEALYQHGRATVSEVLASLPDPPSYSAVRTMLGKLEAKGIVGHHVEGPRFVYFAVAPRRAVQHSALRRVLHKLFNGSATSTVAAVLDLSGDLTEADLDQLDAMIAEKRLRRSKSPRRQHPPA